MSINLRSNYALDKTKASEGEWLEVEDGIWFKVAYMASEATRNRLMKLREGREGELRQQERSNGDGQIALDDLDILAHALVLDWRGIQEQDENGNWQDLPCTPDNIKRALADDPDTGLSMEHVRADIHQFSVNDRNFRHVVESEKLGKNSQSGSSGKSSTGTKSRSTKGQGKSSASAPRSQTAR